MIRPAIALLVLVVGVCAGRADAQTVQEYDYVADAIYPVRTGLGITTEIELSPSEDVVDFSTGFSNGWDLTRRDNVFYLKPRNVDVDTNLVIRTQTHSYIFELRVVATDWKALEQAKQAGVQYRITFRYPNGTQFAATPAIQQAMPALDTRLVPGRPYHFDYDYATRTHQRWLVPLAVYDDGSFTYLRMSHLSDIPTGSFPAVFAREREDGEDFVVNTTVERDTIVVHGTYPYLVVRYGSETVGLRRSGTR